MTLKILKAKDHGKNKTDWLDTKFGFSFANYYNPNNLRFGDLIVFNDDKIGKVGHGGREVVGGSPRGITMTE